VSWRTVFLLLEAALPTSRDRLRLHFLQAHLFRKRVPPSQDPLAVPRLGTQNTKSRAVSRSPLCFFAFGGSSVARVLLVLGPGKMSPCWTTSEKTLRLPSRGFLRVPLFPPDHAPPPYDVHVTSNGAPECWGTSAVCDSGVGDNYAFNPPHVGGPPSM